MMLVVTMMERLLRRHLLCSAHFSLIHVRRVWVNASETRVDKQRISLPKCTTAAETRVSRASVQRISIVFSRIIVADIQPCFLHCGLGCRRRVQHREQAEVEIRQLEEQLLECLIPQQDTNVAPHDRQHGGPQPISALNA